MENLKNLLTIDFKKKSMTDQAKRGLFIDVASAHYFAEDVAKFMKIGISSFLHYKNEHEKLMRSNEKYARLVQYYRTEITKKSICLKCNPTGEIQMGLTSKCSECGDKIKKN
jgi:hypothetical protein